MSNFYKSELTPEEQELDAALDDHRDALKDEMQTMAIAVGIWLVGLVLTAFSPQDSRVEHVGSGLMLMALLVFAVHIALGFRTRKYRYQAKKLLDAYTRKRAIPFYQELTEMFAEKPGIHLHLNESGTIVVSDRRKPTQGKGKIGG